MKPKELKDISSSQRELYKKALQSAQRQNTDYAIKQMLILIKAVPELLPLRQELRKQERIKSGKLGGMGKLKAKLKSLLSVAKIKSKLNKSPKAAMALCEECLAVNLYNEMILNLLADAALNAKAPFIAVETRELIREFDPDNEGNLRKLAAIYKQLEQYNEVVQIFQKIAAMHPNNVSVQSELRSAVALSSMQQGQWNEDGDFKDKLKDQEEAKVLEREDNIIRGEEHIDDMIKRYKAELDEKDSIDTRKRLAALYLQGKYFDEAVEEYQRVAEMIGSFDAAIDKQIEKAYIAKCNDIIRQIEEDPSCIENPEEQLAAWREERDSYRLKRALERVERFTHDAHLHYDLAVVYFDLERFDDAIKHFQRASQNPQLRSSATLYLGRCFAAKGQLDMAIERWEEILQDQSSGMDKQRKETLYLLAEAYEKQQETEKALNYYKEIYKHDINYRDVAGKIDQYYKQNSENENK